jgi:hypothetical protein
MNVIDFAEERRRRRFIQSAACRSALRTLLDDYRLAAPFFYRAGVPVAAFVRLALQRLGVHPTIEEAVCDAIAVMDCGAVIIGEAVYERLSASEALGLTLGYVRRVVGVELATLLEEAYARPDVVSDLHPVQVMQIAREYYARIPVVGAETALAAVLKRPYAPEVVEAAAFAAEGSSRYHVR